MKIIKGAKFTSTSQAFGANVMATGMSETDALAAARQQFGGEEENQVVQEVKTRYAEQSMARERGQSDAADAAYKVYAQTGRISAIPSATWNALHGRVQISFKHEAEIKSQGKAVKTDPDAWQQLWQMSQNDPATFARTDLRAYWSRLDEGDREKFIKLQTDVTRPDAQKVAASLGSQLTTTHDQLGWGKGDEKKIGTFNKAVTDEIDVEQKGARRTLTYSERQAVIDRMVVNGKVDGAGFFGIGGDKPYYQVAGTPDAAGFHPQPTSDEKSQIVKGLKQRGVTNPTDDQISTAYRKWKGF